MKKIPFFIFLLIGYSACKNSPAAKTPETNQADTLFNNWLGMHQLSIQSITDTFVEHADSIWDYSLPLTRTDSLYKWFPSSDSSYYLLTNIDRNSRKSVFNEDDDAEYRFLDTRSKQVHIGITLLNEGPLAPVDIFWEGPQTIYLLEQVKTSRAMQLIKLHMRKDSIWSYKFKIKVQ